MIKRNHLWQIVVLSQLCWSAWNFRCPMFAYQCQCVEKCSGSSITFCNITKETRNSCKQCRYKKCTGKCPCAGNWREEILSLYNKTDSLWIITFKNPSNFLSNTVEMLSVIYSLWNYSFHVAIDVAFQWPSIHSNSPVKWIPQEIKLLFKTEKLSRITRNI